MNIKVRKIQGGMEAIPVNKSDVGLGAKLFNKDLIEPMIKLFDKQMKKTYGNEYKRIDITVTHKKHSKYKWLTVQYDINYVIKYDFIIKSYFLIK